MCTPHCRGAAAVKVKGIVASEVAHQVGGLVVADATAIGHSGVYGTQYDVSAILAVSAQRTTILGARSIYPTVGRGGDIITIEDAHVAAAYISYIGAQVSESGKRHSYFDFDSITIFKIVYEFVGISVAARQHYTIRRYGRRASLTPCTIHDKVHRPIDSPALTGNSRA